MLFYPAGQYGEYYESARLKADLTQGSEGLYVSRPAHKEQKLWGLMLSSLPVARGFKGVMTKKLRYRFKSHKVGRF